MSAHKASILRVAALTHVGRRRHINEDCIAVGGRISSDVMDTPSVSSIALGECGMCLVADGMGGHPAGDVASRLAIETLLATPLDPQMDDAAIVAAVRNANRALFEQMQRTPEITGMGTTIAGVIASGDAVVAFNVGDSRVYRLRGGALEQISIDDSEEIVASFLALEFPTRALNQCLGGYPGVDEITPHLVRDPAEANSIYLICSDGLYDMLSDEAIAACMNDDLEDSVRTLFECAMAEGGIDNISVILARLEHASERAPDRPKDRPQD